MPNVLPTTAARALVDVLVAEGVSHVFCVPGESYLAVLDALADRRESIRVVTCRHEAGAANMAAAYGKLTGRPGICMVTRGPGATHASVGLHTARQDSAPMLMFVGQAASEHREREAFQELDYKAVFGTMTKWAAEVTDPSRMAEFAGRAFATAVQGRAGPVLLALPEDILERPAPPVSQVARVAARSGLDQEALEAIGTRLEAAQRPVLLLGGTGWTEAALDALSGWAAASALPTVLSFRRKDLVDNDAPHYVGDLGLGANPKLVERMRAADLVIALGARLGENPSQGYALFTPEWTAERLVHIYPDPDELGRVWPPAVAACAGVAEAATALARLPADAGRWASWCGAMRAEYEAWTQPVSTVGALNLSRAFAHLAAALPPDAIIANGAGNYAAWLHRFYRHRRFGTQLAPTSGAMGFGLPAAIAAKLARPEREVVAVGGDGCFLMTGQELATAVQHRVGLIVLVVDNGSYGTIRMHQERAFPGRTIATDLGNPDFVAYARAFGAWGLAVQQTDSFPAALAEARARAVAGEVALLHLRTDIRDIAPGKTLALSDSRD